MKQPEGFEDGTNRGCLLKKSLYGLKQAPRCWNKRIVDVILKAEITKSDADPCLFIKKQENGNGLLILSLYVDDGLLTSNIEMMKNDFLKDLRKEFKISVKPAFYFLGLEIERNSDNFINICQKSYAKKLLEKFKIQSLHQLLKKLLNQGRTWEKSRNFVIEKQ